MQDDDDDGSTFGTSGTRQAAGGDAEASPEDVSPELKFCKKAAAEATTEVATADHVTQQTVDTTGVDLAAVFADTSDDSLPVRATVSFSRRSRGSNERAMHVSTVEVEATEERHV